VDPDPLQSYKSDPDLYQGYADPDGDLDPACHPDVDADLDLGFQKDLNQC
jgi:hypothetical protein